MVVGGIQINSDQLKLLKNVDVRARTFQLIAQLPSHKMLMPGMSAFAWVPNGTIENTLSVPKDAIVQHGNNTLVYRIVEKQQSQTAQSVAVSVLFYQGDRVALRGDVIKPGDQVVVKGNERLIPGAVTAIPVDDLSK